MMEIPVYNMDGQQVGTHSVDEQLLGGEVRPVLLKQAYVRLHGNRRLGTAATRSRGKVEGSTRKLYRQKGTGNARRGAIRTNVMRGGGVAFAKHPRSFRQDMPVKMRRLANRNALLAKAVDNEIKLVEGLDFDKPSTRRFAALLKALEINRPCLVALEDTRNNTALSARNVDDARVIRIDQVNVFNVLNHRYLLADRASFERYLERCARGADAGAKVAAATAGEVS